jgi:predicted DNA-binding transcriptional regulator YafY
MPDTMTIRNKLNEYVTAGLFQKHKNGKTLHYFISDSQLDKALPEIINELAVPIHFFENITPAGVLGYFIRRDTGQNPGIFSFRHLFASHTLDDEVLLKILSAIQEQRSIQFETCSNRSKNPFRQTILPLKIAINVKHGRRYLLAYNNRTHNFFSYRLDYLKKVKVLEQSSVFTKHLSELEARLLRTWGVYLGRKNHIEQLEMVLAIDEESEAYVLTRLKREGKHGTVEKLADNRFVYRIEVSDTQEMVPWLRTFIGRIISLTGSNQRIMKQFHEDIKCMTHMYED